MVSRNTFVLLFYFFGTVAIISNILNFNKKVFIREYVYVGASLRHSFNDVVLIVPYRDREKHKSDFLAHMSEYFKKRFPLSNINVIISEQGDDDDFSRSFLFNAGFLWAQENIEYHESTCFIVHDIDRIPRNDAQTVPYTDCEFPTHLNSENDEWNGGVPYKNYIGGTMSMTERDWLVVNGMPNSMKGWGGEDDVVLHRFRFSKTKWRRPKKDFGHFTEFPSDKYHKRAPFDEEKYKINTKILLKEKKGLLWHIDGINSCEFNVIEIMTLVNTPKFQVVQVTFKRKT